MERELRLRSSNRSKTDEMKEATSDEPKATGAEENEHKNSKDIEEMETDALKKGKEDKDEQEVEEKEENKKPTKGTKRKAPEEQPASKDKDTTAPVADKTSSERGKPESDSKESTPAKPADEVLPASKPAALPLTPPRKQAKRSEPEGPLLSIEEQKLMDTDVLSLLKRFAPKYYVPLPKIWAIPKSQLTTTQSRNA